MKPTLHVTNWSSRKLHGPGRKLSIMRAPRAWEHGDGRANALTPSPESFSALRAGRISPERYRGMFKAKIGEAFDRDFLRLGRLYAVRWWTAGEVRFFVEDSDTLCCACSRAAAAEGKCHRVWAAEALVAASWRVILDGRELTCAR